MAVTAKWYGKAFISAFNKEVDFQGGTIKCSLHTSSYTPDQDTHQYRSSTTASECTATGNYATGGATVSSPTVTYDGATNTIKLDGADVSWTSSTITARYAIVYDSAPGTDATRPLICYVDFGENVASSGGTFSITWDTAGIATLTVS